LLDEALAGQEHDERDDGDQGGRVVDADDATAALIVGRDASTSDWARHYESDRELHESLDAKRDQ
jgi:hypothetical protein